VTPIDGVSVPRVPGDHTMRTTFKNCGDPDRRLAHQSRCDYLVTMISVRIAELKAKLSEYLRTVRKGHSITILDRDTPIARIVPYEPEASGLVSRKPTSRVPFGKIPLPEPHPLDIDIVQILLEERQVDR